VAIGAERYAIASTRASGARRTGRWTRAAEPPRVAPPSTVRRKTVYARVARWEGAEADQVRGTAEQISSDASSGPPEGVPAKGFLLLIDPDNGRSLAVGLFETEEDLRKGDETLNAMSPPDDGMGRRASVETYEGALDVRA
jgi:hypothetical protein